MSRYHDRIERRKQRYQELAEKNRQRSAAAYKQSDDIIKHIPPGQPILVGHHSERRHRRTLEQCHKAMDRSLEHDRKARYYEGKAASVGQGGISSDDPEALDQLREKLAKREQRQEMMKKANRIVRKKTLSNDQKIDALKEFGINGAQARMMLEGDFCGRIGFPDYALKNNNAEIRRIKKRIEELEASADLETTEKEHGDIIVRENTDINRIQLIFPGKPSAAVRQKLGKYGLGFRWSRTEGAWQRHLNNAGRSCVQLALEYIDELGGWQ